MSESIYIETTIPSYLTARPSGIELVAMHQRLTGRWWNDERANYQLFTSQVVLDEASIGDQDMVSNRLKELSGIPLLDLSDEVVQLADAFLSAGVVPKVAECDATHIAVSCVYKLDYLLTWNCKHIANTHIQARLRRIALSKGYELPLLTTPEDMILSEP